MTPGIQDGCQCKLKRAKNAKVTPKRTLVGPIHHRPLTFFPIFLYSYIYGRCVASIWCGNKVVPQWSSQCLWSICHWGLSFKNQFLDFRPPWGGQKLKILQRKINYQIPQLLLNKSANFDVIPPTWVQMAAVCWELHRWAIIWRDVKKVMKWKCKKWCAYSLPPGRLNTHSGGCASLELTFFLNKCTAASDWLPPNHFSKTFPDFTVQKRIHDIDISRVSAFSRWRRKQTHVATRCNGSYLG